jgi:hypothetical protein
LQACQSIAIRFIASPHDVGGRKGEWHHETST